jgi:GNAT superfamily N-acetyltransferase
MSTNEPVVVRPALPADADRIAALFTDEGYPVGTSGVVARLERVEAERTTVLVADLGGEVIGVIALHLLPRFEHDDHAGRILALVVDPGARARGIGGLLVEAAERVAAESGAAYVEVTAGHHRPEARRLLESRGYDASVTTYLRKRI